MRALLLAVAFVSAACDITPLDRTIACDPTEGQATEVCGGDRSGRACILTSQSSSECAESAKTRCGVGGPVCAAGTACYAPRSACLPVCYCGDVDCGPCTEDDVFGVRL